MEKQKMPGQTAIGKCYLCNTIVTKAEATKHLESCRQREAICEKTLSKKIAEKTKFFHIIVESSVLPEYWMHIDAPANAKLEDLDNFLREMWLECCGHMSAFTIQKARYIAGRGIDSMWMGIGMIPGGRSMNIGLDKVLTPQMKFCHEYDFGTTTELTLRVVSERESEIRDKSIELLARNEPPIRICACGKNATQVCTQCIYEGKGWLCDDCAEKHECGEDMLLPVVNSPRVGMCGYTRE
jgi:hypothetical protein